MPNVFKSHRPSWWRRGLRIVGNWEPLLFRRRRGGMPEEPAGLDLYESEHTEENVLRLKERGVNMIVTHFYKGMGIEAERPEMEKAVALAELCHKHGMLCGGYCQWNTLGYETFFKEEPKAREWIQVRADGQPVTLTYGHQPFRYNPCFNNDAYRAYYHRVIEMAVKEARFDMIHMDNCAAHRPPPEVCHCRHCREKFTAFLRRKYNLDTDEGRQKALERFGHLNLDLIELPVFVTFIPPWDLKEIRDPGTQEWIDFSCDAFDRYVGEVAELIRRLNPECGVEINCGMAPGISRPFISGVDENRVYRHVDVAWSEESHANSPRLEPDGRLVSQIRSFKRARGLDTALLTYTHLRDGSSARRELVMAEALAYNAPTLGCLGGILTGAEDLPEQRRYIDFFLKNEPYYLDAESLADVAVLSNYHTLAHLTERPHLEQILVEQTLIQGHVPFDIICDAQLSDLSKYRVLVLPDVQWLSRDYEKQIRDYVESGGGLVITGDTGGCDRWGRVRPEAAFADWFGSEPATSMRLRDIGPSRCALLPLAKPGKPFVKPIGTIQDYRAISNEYWHLPENAPEILDAVRWTAGGRFQVELTAPQSVTAECMAQPNEGRTLIHLVNFDTDRDVAGVGVSLARETAPGSIVALSPDREERLETDPAVEFVAPPFGRYQLLVVT